MQVAGNRVAARQERIREAVAAAVACPLCPHVTPEFGEEILSTGFKPVGQRPVTETARARAEVFTEDPAWRQKMFEWIGSYWTDHGHGPTWSEVRHEPSLWPDEVPMHVRRLTIAILTQARHLDGTKTPFGLRPRTSTADQAV